jgi:hypothetical protein
VTGLGAKTGVERYGEVEAQLGQISDVFDEQGFCNELISAVNIATTYRNDIDR